MYTPFGIVHVELVEDIFPYPRCGSCCQRHQWHVGELRPQTAKLLVIWSEIVSPLNKTRSYLITNILLQGYCRIGNGSKSRNVDLCVLHLKFRKCLLIDYMFVSCDGCPFCYLTDTMSLVYHKSGQFTAAIQVLHHRY